MGNKMKAKIPPINKIFMNDNIFETIGILNCNKTCYYNSDENCTHPTQKTTKHYETDKIFSNDDNDESIMTTPSSIFSTNINSRFPRRSLSIPFAEVFDDIQIQ